MSESSSSAISSDVSASLGVRRYPHEPDNPKPIPGKNHAKVFELLRSLYRAVRLNGPTLSQASRTSIAAPSEGSTGTPNTNNGTLVFSVSDAFAPEEPKKKPLSLVLQARKALIRKLVSCDDCRQSKIKVKTFQDFECNEFNVSLVYALAPRSSRPSSIPSYPGGRESCGLGPPI
jgi:hypothetical protein